MQCLETLQHSFCAQMLNAQLRHIGALLCHESTACIPVHLKPTTTSNTGLMAMTCIAGVACQAHHPGAGNSTANQAIRRSPWSCFQLAPALHTATNTVQQLRDQHTGNTLSRCRTFSPFILKGCCLSTKCKAQCRYKPLATVLRNLHMTSHQPHQGCCNPVHPQQGGSKQTYRHKHALPHSRNAHHEPTPPRAQVLLCIVNITVKETASTKPPHQQLPAPHPSVHVAAATAQYNPSAAAVAASRTPAAAAAAAAAAPDTPTRSSGCGSARVRCVTTSRLLSSCHPPAGPQQTMPPCWGVVSTVRYSP